MQRVEAAAGIAQRLDADARRDEVGLGVVVDRGRAARAEGRHGVVGTIGRSHVTRRADGQHPRRIAGRRNAGVLNVAFRATPVVSGRGHDNDTCVNRLTCRQRQRVGEVRLVHARRNREVDHAQAQGIAVGHGITDRGDDVARPALPLRVEHLEHRQPHAWRDAGPRAARIGAAARDDPGHVRPVPEVVVGVGAAGREVDEPFDALAAVGAPEIVMPWCHARVDHRDADAGAVEAEARADGCCAHGRAGALHCSGDAVIERHVGDKRARCKRGDGAERQIDGDARDHGERTDDASAHERNNGQDGCQLQRRIRAQDDAGAAGSTRQRLQNRIKLREEREGGAGGRRPRRTERHDQEDRGEDAREPSRRASHGAAPQQWMCPRRPRHAGGGNRNGHAGLRSTGRARRDAAATRRALRECKNSMLRQRMCR
jgi:hypothetical protein